MKLPVEKDVENDDIKPVTDLKITKEEENEFNEGVIFEKMPEVLTRGHLVNTERVTHIEKRLKFSSYVLSPVKYPLRKFIRVLTNVFKFVFKLRRAVLARKISEKNGSETIQTFEVKEAENVLKFTSPMLKNPLENTPNFVNISSFTLLNQTRVTQRTTDRAVRSLIKIFDVDDFVLEEDLAHLGRLLVDGDDSTDPAPATVVDVTTATDDELHHHSCQLQKADILQVYPARELKCAFKLINSLVSGQSGVKLPPRDVELHGDVREERAGGVGSHYWPEADVPGVPVSLHGDVEEKCYLCRPINSSFIEEENYSYRSESSYKGLIDLITSTNVIKVNHTI